MPHVSSNKQTPRCNYYVPDFLTGLLEIYVKNIRGRIRPVSPSRLEILKIASLPMRAQLRESDELVTSLMHKFLFRVLMHIVRNLLPYDPDNEAEPHSYRLTHYLKISGSLDQIPSPDTSI